MKLIKHIGSAKLFANDNGHKQLRIDDVSWMSNSQKEREEHGPILSMFGHVLIVGLGLGLAVEMALTVEAIQRITVLESNRDVIELVPVPAEIEVVCGDAKEWEPSNQFDCVWLDIWRGRDGEGRQELADRFCQWARVVECWPSGLVKSVR